MESTCFVCVPLVLANIFSAFNPAQRMQAQRSMCVC